MAQAPDDDSDHAERSPDITKYKKNIDTVDGNRYKENKSHGDGPNGPVKVLRKSRAKKKRRSTKNRAKDAQDDDDDEYEDDDEKTEERRARSYKKDEPMNGEPQEHGEITLLHILIKHSECTDKSSHNHTVKKINARSKSHAAEKLQTYLDEMHKLSDAQSKAARFRKMASKKSDCILTSKQSGEIKFTRTNLQLGREIMVQKAFALENGAISDIIESDRGLHIIMRIH